MAHLTQRVGPFVLASLLLAGCSGSTGETTGSGVGFKRETGELAQPNANSTTAGEPGTQPGGQPGTQQQGANKPGERPIGQPSSTPNTPPNTPPNTAPTPVPPTPTAAPTQPSEPAATPTVDPLSPLGQEQQTALWSGLANYTRVGKPAQRAMRWFNLTGGVMTFSNAESLWDESIAKIRDEYLQLHLDQGIQPAQVFAGSSYALGETSSAVVWWTNGASGTKGRGQVLTLLIGMQQANGTYLTHMRPVLFNLPGLSPTASRKGEVLSVGPIFAMKNTDLPADRQETFNRYNAAIQAWLMSQPVINDPVELPCPETVGCSKP